MASYLARHRDAITDSLRAASMDDFDRGVIPSGYAAKAGQLAAAVLRRTAAPPEWSHPLDPDPAWLDLWELPPDAAMAERLAAWLGTDADLAAGSVGSLPPLAEVRSANVRALAEFFERASMLLPLWAAKQGGISTPSWLAAGSADELVAEVSGRGLLDFRALDDVAIIAWLSLMDRWPADLPSSLALGDLGLTEADVAAQRDEANRVKWERQQARRSVALDGRPVSLDPTGLPTSSTGCAAG